MLCIILTYFFFFKQKTAYEMRISDWSSDVCSSDLVLQHLLVMTQHAGSSLAGAEGQLGDRDRTAEDEEAVARDEFPASRAGGDGNAAQRSEERRGGQEGGSTC